LLAGSALIADGRTLLFTMSNSAVFFVPARVVAHGFVLHLIAHT
jgi:hypothetical protein